MTAFIRIFMFAPQDRGFGEVEGIVQCAMLNQIQCMTRYDLILSYEKNLVQKISKKQGFL